MNDTKSKNPLSGRRGEVSREGIGQVESADDLELVAERQTIGAGRSGNNGAR
jgi:hypothetical protein